MQKVNYQRRLDETLRRISERGETPRLLLHACCAPCSSYVLSYLCDYFSVTLYYDNPNISPYEEYRRRGDELKKLVSLLPVRHPVTLCEADWDPAPFFALAKGHEDEPEGGARCRACYELRLTRAAEQAVKCGADYFTTTLSVSPYKHADVLNELGGALAERCGVPYLFSDFKKRGGYQQSIALSNTYQLYRQNYCGCVYSAAARRRKDAQANGELPL